MTDPKVIEALHMLYDRAFQNELSPEQIRVRDLIDALYAERKAALRAEQDARRFFGLAADALKRSPDAIRRTAIEEAAWVASLQTTDGSDFDVALHIAREIRALATGPTPPTPADIRARVENLERTEIETTATGRRAEFVALADVLAAFDGTEDGHA